MSHSVVAISYYSALSQMSKEKTPLTEADRQVEFRRVYQDRDKQWVILGNPHRAFERLKEKYESVINVPETILTEVMQLNTSGTSFDITVEEVKEFFGVVSLEDYLNKYPGEAEVKSWQVKTKNETRLGSVEVTDERWGYTGKKISITGL